MTNKEAADLLDNLIGMVSDNHDSDYDEALSKGRDILKSEPCEDCISRQAVLKAIDVKAWEFCDYLIRNGRNDEQKPVSHFADNLREYVGEDLPPVTPQPKTGHWIIKDGKEQGYDIGGVKTWYIQIMCSECGFIKTAIEGHTGQYHFCPNCGARMVEPQESEDKE